MGSDAELLELDEIESLSREIARIARCVMRENRAQIRWRSRQIAEAELPRDGTPLRTRMKRVVERAAAVGVVAACEPIRAN